MVIRTEQLSSSAIASTSYDDEMHELEVTFVSGSTYTLHDVPQDVFDAFVASPSPGRYWHSVLKGTYT